jgi:NAD(P)-dependent dehydrogenase (short-subunit alcohol dehydrogenase family)
MRDSTGRNAPSADDLARFASDTDGRLEVLDMDVTSDDSVDNAVRRVLETVDTLDVVVNNAGVGSGGYAETFTPEQYRDLYDINVLGVQRVNRAVLPSMRNAGTGLLIHVSSIMGRITIPFSGPYTASKWALEGLVETYRYELAPTGVDVAIVEPGGFPTGIMGRMMAPADGDRAASYGALADVPEKAWGGFVEALSGPDAPDSQLVADAVVALIETPAGKRPLRTVVDPLTGGEGPRALNRASDEIQAQVLEGMGLGDSVTVRPTD